MTEQAFTLEEVREAYRRVSARADEAIRLIGELRTKRIWLDHKTALLAIAQHCWDLADEGVYDEFASPKAYMAHLVSEECLVLPPASDEIGGRSAMCLTPFFPESGSRFKTALGLS